MRFRLLHLWFLLLFCNSTLAVNWKTLFGNPLKKLNPLRTNFDPAENHLLVSPLDKFCRPITGVLLNHERSAVVYLLQSLSQDPQFTVFLYKPSPLDHSFILNNMLQAVCPLPSFNEKLIKAVIDDAEQQYFSGPNHSGEWKMSEDELNVSIDLERTFLKIDPPSNNIPRLEAKETYFSLSTRLAAIYLELADAYLKDESKGNQFLSKSTGFLKVLLLYAVFKQWEAAGGRNSGNSNGNVLQKSDPSMMNSNTFCNSQNTCLQGTLYSLLAVLILTVIGFLSWLAIKSPSQPQVPTLPPITHSPETHASKPPPRQDSADSWFYLLGALLFFLVVGGLLYWTNQEKKRVNREFQIKLRQYREISKAKLKAKVKEMVKRHSKKVVKKKMKYAKGESSSLVSSKEDQDFKPKNRRTKTKPTKVSKTRPSKAAIKANIKTKASKAKRSPKGSPKTKKKK